jgi:hypothetical protein
VFTADTNRTVPPPGKEGGRSSLGSMLFLKARTPGVPE